MARDDDRAFGSLLEVLEYRATDASGTANNTAFVFLKDGEQISGSLTFYELDQNARRVAGYLQTVTRSGDRVLLAYPPGLEFMIAFWGCLYAGVIAVPAAAPASAESVERLQLIAHDSDARLGLSLEQVIEKMTTPPRRADRAFGELNWIASDTIVGIQAEWVRPKVSKDDIAFLQYTSGSTKHPRGVRVRHANIFANVRLLRKTFPLTPQDTTVSWLPLYHDMGLIGKVIGSLFCGSQCIQFPAKVFLMRPYRWLKLISTFRARLTAAPNFAYELCARRITRAQKESIDLTSLEFALNGAEPIRAATLHRFADAFSECGFRRGAIVPVYGLAEATLFVSANKSVDPTQLPQTIAVSKRALGEGTIGVPSALSDRVEVVAVGATSLDDHNVAVVDPITLTPNADGTVGEIIVVGPSVASGYWKHSDDDHNTFVSLTPGEGGAVLRTGDLGFIQNGQLHITGRMKEVMIFNGRNVYPQDIEATIESIDPAFRVNGCAAFAEENDTQTQLVIVQEVEAGRTPLVHGLAEKIHIALATQHELFDIAAIVLVRVGHITRTSSGKIQRIRCKEFWQSNRLEAIWTWSTAKGVAEGEVQDSHTRSSTNPIVKKKLVDLWRELLNTDEISDTAHFFDLGGNSILIAMLHQRLLEEWKVKIALTDLFRYPTIDSLARHLSVTDQLSAGKHEQQLLGSEHSAPRRVNKNQGEGSVAIVGMSGRFPGARDLSEFWDKISRGEECITFSSNEQPQGEHDSSIEISGSHHVGASAILADAEVFDAEFFGLSPREAEITDPQHRVFLECSWHAFENAGYDPISYKGPIGVFAASSLSTYLFDNLASNPNLRKSVGDLACLIGNDKDYLATRVSYKLNLRGPSVTVQAACSSSLVAVHLACQSLMNGKCKMALAGGVTVRTSDSKGYCYTEDGIFSRDGHCRAFDAKASGTLFGSGVGVVILKLLKDAITDGDTIHAVIKGGAVNNDGAERMGFTAPSMTGQAVAIAEAQAVAQVSADSISYVEAHGTGTLLGDPIEVAALTAAFRRSTERKQFCALGTVKTNVGHLEVASGIVGLIKTVLALKHRAIPPSLNYEEANPKIDFVNSPFFVNTQLRKWDTEELPRRAGVSSFGFGGTNVHIILEEAPVGKTSNMSKAYQLLVMSARTKTALDTVTDDFTCFLANNAQGNVADVAYTSQVGRHHFSHRRVVLCRAIEDAAASLAEKNPKTVWTGIAGNTVPGLTFMFPGQGTQYINMARELYDSEDTFRYWIDRGAELLHSVIELDVRTVLFPEPGMSANAAVLLSQTHITQPALFLIEYALTRQLSKWGVNPTSMVGHSLGEYVAACVAEVISFNDALVLVGQRGKLIGELPAGKMLAVYAREEALQHLLSDDVSVAAVNAAAICTVSGTVKSIERLEDQLKNEQVIFHVLNTSHAFHSSMMEPILERFYEVVNRIELHRPSIPYLSNVTGDWVDAEQVIDPSYWVTHIRQTVRFASCLEKLTSSGKSLLLEVGPGHALSTLARHHQPQWATSSFATLPDANKADHALASIMTAVGQLWLNGIPVRWDNFHRHQWRQRIPLPTYAFERKRHWIEPSSSNNVPQSAATGADRHRDAADWFYVPAWKRLVRPFPGNGTIPPPRNASHLVFYDESDLCKKIVEQLTHAGEQIISVTRGTNLDVGRNAYVINEEQPKDYEQLVASLVAHSSIPEKITYLWSLTPSRSVNSPSLQDPFFSLVFLAQALGKAEICTPIVLNVISTGVHSVHGGELLVPENATVLGPCQVIPLEHPNIQCRYIDVELKRTSSSNDELSRLVSEEICSPILERIVACRGKHRWAQTLEPIRYCHNPSSLRRQHGHYLITGGMGGIGFTFAQYLANRYKSPHITIVGRSPFPNRNEWDTYLTDLQDGAVSDRIRQIRKLEAVGAKVQYISADISNEDSFQHLVSESKGHFGEVHGIFHAAGLPGDEPIANKTPAKAWKILGPKVIGTRLLEAFYEGAQLDFFVLCSSVSAFLPVVGQVDYCGASAFLDAYAQAQHLAEVKNVISVDWYAWQEIGMAAEMALPSTRLESLKDGIPPQEAPRLFDIILSVRLPQILISPITIDAVRAVNERFNALADSSGVSSGAQKTQSLRPSLATEFVPPKTESEKMLAVIWQEFLGISSIGIHDDFHDLGGNSLLAVQLISRVRVVFQVDLPLKALFECFTIAALAKKIDMSLQDQEEVEV